MFGFHSTNVKNVVQVEVFVVTLKYVGCSDLVNTQNRLSSVSSERDIVPSVVIQVLTWRSDGGNAAALLTRTMIRRATKKERKKNF